MSAWSVIRSAATAARTDITIPVDAAELALTSGELSCSWGAQPATATLVYASHLGPDEDIRTRLPAVPVGAYCTVTLGPYVFHGRCKGDVARMASGGAHVRVFDFEDLRGDLQMDVVFGSFNHRDERLVPDPVTGIPRRIRQWRHLLPANWETNVWTYTPAPMSAWDILNLLRTAATVGSPWTFLNHDALALPAYGIDFSGGVRLDSALLAVCEKVGVQFTLSGYFQLKFRRKGQLVSGETFPTTLEGWYAFPADASRIDGDALRDGFALSGHPTRISVVGDRNRYQVPNLVLEPDWARAWDVWWDERFFLVWVFALTPTVPGDVDDVRRWANAQQTALQLTVADVAAQPSAGAAFADARKHGGKSRLQMPAVLYIRELVFRAWRLPATVLGRDMRSWQLADSLLCAVTHNVSGVMTADLTRPQPGNGYIIAAHFGLNVDALRAVNPFRFRLDEWLVANKAWGVAPFQSGGDGGDGVPYIVFDEQVYDPQPGGPGTGLVLQPDGEGGAVVFNAAWAPLAPVVRACLALLGETFIHRVGTGSRDAVTSESELHREFVKDASGTSVGEIPYVDGETPQKKATDLANCLLLRQAVFHSGGYERTLNDGDSAFVLNGMYDRVRVALEDNGLTKETIDFTTERTFASFQQERQYDRRVRSADLFPGQEALQAELLQARLVANQYAANPGHKRAVAAAYRGSIGLVTETSRVTVSGAAVGSALLPAGAPLWQAPARSSVDTGAPLNRPVLPVAAGSAHRVLAGVTTRQNESPLGEVPIVDQGRVLVRAKGPVSLGDSLGRSDGHDYVVAGGADPALVARGEIVGTGIKLILAEFGGGGGASVSARWR